MFSRNLFNFTANNFFVISMKYYVRSVYNIHLFEHTMSMHVYSNYYGAYACLASAYKQYL